MSESGKLQQNGCVQKSHGYPAFDQCHQKKAADLVTSGIHPTAQASPLSLRSAEFPTDSSKSRQRVNFAPLHYDDEVQTHLIHQRLRRQMEQAYREAMG